MLKQLTNKFVAAVPMYNIESYIEDCLTSIFDQDYDDVGVILRDDMSTDGTCKVIEDIIGIDGKTKQQTTYNGRDIIFIQNERKLNAGGNVYESAMDFVPDESVVGVVDGDDYLCKSYSISRIMEEYDDPNIWLVWSQHRLAGQNNIAGMSKDLPGDDVIYSSRQYWSVSHFRTNKKWLFNHIAKEELIDPNNKETYFEVCGDAAYIFPITEMSGNEHAKFVPEVLYHLSLIHI